MGRSSSIPRTGVGCSGGGVSTGVDHPTEIGWSWSWRETGPVPPSDKKCDCLCRGLWRCPHQGLALFLLTWNSFKAEKQLHRVSVDLTHHRLGKSITVQTEDTPKHRGQKAWG